MKNLFILIIFVIVTAGVAGGSVWWWQKQLADSQARELKDKIHDLEQDKQKEIQSRVSSVLPVSLPPQQNITADGTCSFGLRAGQCNSDQNRYLRLVAPNGGEQLCLNQDAVIKWEHKGMGSVSIYAGLPNGRYIALGNYPADFNEIGEKGSGLILWLPDSMDEGYAYKIAISSSTGGYLYADESDNFFSLEQCEG